MVDLLDMLTKRLAKKVSDTFVLFKTSSSVVLLIKKGVIGN